MTVGDNFLNSDGQPVDFWGLAYTGRWQGGKCPLSPKPKAGIWPPPVYEAHYSDGSVQRYSFWSAKGKPVQTAGIHERMAERGVRGLPQLSHINGVR